MDTMSQIMRTSPKASDILSAASLTTPVLLFLAFSALSGCGAGEPLSPSTTTPSSTSTGGGGGNPGGSSAGDTTKPAVTISSPTSAASLIANSGSLTLGGSASDNVGVTQVTWTNSLGGSGTATGTTSWSTGGITLATGTNIITVTARDIAGNTGTDTIQVDYNNTPVVGVTYYVATNGSNTNNGLSTAAPFLTVGKAVSVVNPGDAIEIRAGTYTESITISRAGSANGWITMRPYNNESVILQSTGSGPTVYFYHNNCDANAIANSSDPTGNTNCKSFYWTIQGLELRGSPNGGADGNAIKIDTPNVKLIGNRLCCSKADVVKLVRSSNQVELLNNEIWQDPAIVAPGLNAQGIDIVGADDVRVANNYLHDINDIGMYAKGNSRRAIFENNRLENIGLSNGANALMLGQSTDAARLSDGTYESYDSVMRNNIVRNTGGPCLATASSYNVRIYNNSCYNTGQSTHGSILLSNESEVRQSGTNIEIRNNIIYGSANKPVLKVSNYMGPALTDNTTLHMDHNIYYVGGTSPTFDWDGSQSSGLANWKTYYTSVTGNTDTSLSADPLYADTTMLTLNAASPAINAGVDTPYVTSDYAGNTRPSNGVTDIGAYEY